MHRGGSRLGSNAWVIWTRLRCHSKNGAANQWTRQTPRRQSPSGLCGRFCNSENALRSLELATANPSLTCLGDEACVPIECYRGYRMIRLIARPTAYRAEFGLTDADLSRRKSSILRSKAWHAQVPRRMPHHNRRHLRPVIRIHRTGSA